MIRFLRTTSQLIKSKAMSGPLNLCKTVQYHLSSSYYCQCEDRRLPLSHPNYRAQNSKYDTFDTLLSNTDKCTQ